MARKRRAVKSQPIKPWQILLLVLAIGAGYLYEQGFFDRWLKDTDWARNPTATPGSPQSPGTGGAPGPEVDVPRAYVTAGEWYQVYFTRPDYPEKAANRTGGVDAAVIADIDAAQSSVRIAVFEFDVPALTDALLRAKKRGLTVEMVVDADNLEAAQGAEEMGRIEAAKIPVTYDERTAFMHNKIVLIDDKVVWAGSMNLKQTEIYRNNNNFLRIGVPQLVDNYRQRFADLFAGRMGGNAPANTPNPVIKLDGGVVIENYFSPSDGARAHLLRYLAGAKKSVRMLAFSFTDDATAEQLVALHKAGVDVQVVMEARSETGTGSEFGVLQKAGINILADGNCYIQHNKVFIIDERTVVTGSYNFTGAAEDSNDENMLIITDPNLAKTYLENFDRIQQQAINPTRCGGS
ncbi:MAG TPA: phospholipase D-like domain-containing protein [Herpetosiphonaceae bacterium]